ncbi:uncharacterized protein [Elaeis guineensis]|uniref:Uncharacterized protein LOC105046174 isoform X2 n=1 Tax=Elaeis guineensis var. tenera TaxID=51953 RepID=A0A6J0PKJ7_ELAGV|nr:uncharacterized protein LOC105046174 isoform X2 [Elaeis guineensis]
MGDGYGESKRKRRKKKASSKKLLLGEKVEVLYSDEGLKGSWHVGVVINCGEFSRLVEYTDLLSEDQHSKLVEWIPVSPAVEGLHRTTPKDYRGQIRPLPPHCDIRQSELRYGLCVDALVDDAWWEGVVFDRKDGSTERLVFFPDQGDQHMISIDQLRPTQMWDEVSGHWKPRGEWLLLQVLQILEQEGALPVSVREIWYDLRTMAAFWDKIRMWMFGSRSIWHSLVSQLIQELQSVVLGKPLAGALPGCQLVDAPMNFGDIDIAPEDISCMEVRDIQNNDVGMHTRLDVTTSKFQCRKLQTLENNSLFGCADSSCKTKCSHERCSHASYLGVAVPDMHQVAKFHLLPAGCDNKESDSGEHCKSLIKSCEAHKEVEVQNMEFDGTNNHSTRNGTGAEVNNILRQMGSETGNRRVGKSWQPVNLEAEFCPKAVELCVYGSKDRYFPTGKLEVIEKVKKHLLALGWKVEVKRDTMLRLRCISPEGKCYYTLHKACCALIDKLQKKDQKCRNDKSSDLCCLGCNLCVSLPRNIYSEPASLVRDPPMHSFPSKKHERGSEHCTHDVVEFATSMDAENNRTCTELRAYPKMVDSNDQLDSGTTEASPLKILEEQQHCGASCSMLRKKNLESSTEISPEDMNSKKSGCLSFNVQFEDSNKELSLCRIQRPFTAMACDEFEESTRLSRDVAEKGSKIVSNFLEQEPRFGTLHVRELKKSERRRTTYLSIPLKALRSKLKQRSSCSQKSNKGKASQALRQRYHESRKRSQEVVLSSTGQHFARTPLSMLIDNNIILPRQKVHYIRKRDGQVMLEGCITRGGIKCKCCKKLYGLSKFQAHAGGTNQKAAACIFLKDGRSLLQCQMQMVPGTKVKSFSHPRLKSLYSLCRSDTICSVCQYGGKLMLCDHCPSAFHPGCVALEDVPKGKWFCPSCRCGICGSSDFNCDTKEFTDKTILYCDQCEREYHVGCLRKRGMSRLENYPAGNWFCSNTCSEIFLCLHALLGQSKPTSQEALSWTILRGSGYAGIEQDHSDVETTTGYYSKLHVALNILHECFVTMIEPRTQSDLIADILFNKESDLNRLNFWGFYTMLLERGDEVISVATFRVYGDKVAEMPLIGTRVQYRRQGMCRLLLDELEKLLSSLGVERLLIPAVPELLETWTTSFGFTKMSSLDRVKYLEYTLLNFQDTTMCQKLLRAASMVSKKSRGIHDQLPDGCSKNLENVDSDIHIPISEVAEMTEPIKKLMYFCI